MNQTWLDQLTSTGSKPETNGSEQASLPEDSVQFIGRGDLAVIRFSGDDAGTFLQSQTCNDHNAVSANTAQLDGYCSPKGRLLALPTVIADDTGDTFYWLLAKDLVAPVVKRLTMFVLRSDVTITVQEDWVVVGLAAKSDQLNASLEPWFGDSETEVMASWTVNSHRVIKAPGGSGVSRSLLFGPVDALKQSLSACIEVLPDHASEPLWSASSSWALGDIKAGIPSIVAKTQDAFVPQMVNLEQVGGLSFTKGCYPGQEIVARMQYLGKLKRAMVRFSSEESSVAQPGDKLAAGDDENAGEVVNSVATGNGMECLAVIKTSADPSAFTLNGGALNAEELPYT